MANPLIVACPADTWVKVATNVVTGMIYELSNLPNVYWQTYRLTGVAGPTDLTEAVPAFVGNKPEPISATVGIDVYIYAKKVIGSIRVDV